MWARIHLIPLLQAEEDRDQVRRHYADKAREQELLGAETKVYHGDRYARQYGDLDQNLALILIEKICASYLFDYTTGNKGLKRRRRACGVPGLCIAGVHNGHRSSKSTMNVLCYRIW